MPVTQDRRVPALAGMLRDTVTMQKRGPDTNGDPLGPWADQFDAAAQVLAITPARPQQGEVVSDERRVGIQPIQVTLRFTPQSAVIDTDWRVVWLGWAFDLTVMDVNPIAATVTLYAIRSRAGDTPP
jgi:hypothetical protein